METLSRHFRELTKAAFARHGFAYAELLAQWPAVVGEDLAQACEPDRIRWPRGQAEGQRKSGGTLVIRAAAGRGLELQHETPRIVERINGFYGYAAVAGLHIVQSATLSSSRRKPGPKPATEKNVEHSSLGQLGPGFRRDDELDGSNGLEAALSRLGQGIGLTAMEAGALKTTSTSSNQDES